MKCKICEEIYSEKFDEDFIDGECLPCRSQKEYDEHEAEELQRLEKWNERKGKSYNYDEFHYACDDKEIELEELKGFPLLKEIWKQADNMKKEQIEVDRYYEGKRQQPDLFEHLENDLPF